MLLASCQPDKSTYTYVRKHARYCLYLPIANNGNVLRTKSNNRLGCSMRIRLACVSTFFPNRCLVDFVSTNSLYFPTKTLSHTSPIFLLPFSKFFFRRNRFIYIRRQFRNGFNSYRIWFHYIRNTAVFSLKRYLFVYFRMKYFEIIEILQYFNVIPKRMVDDGNVHPLFGALTFLNLSRLFGNTCDDDTMEK